MTAEPLELGVDPPLCHDLASDSVDVKATIPTLPSRRATAFVIVQQSGTASADSAAVSVSRQCHNSSETHRRTPVNGCGLL